MTATAQPRWPHDCDRCVFLGSFDAGTGWGDTDLWYHPDGHDTVIARYGRKSHYTSGIGLVHLDPRLRECLRRAAAAGLVCKERADCLLSAQKGA
jgi:hypothetical protein